MMIFTQNMRDHLHKLLQTNPNPNIADIFLKAIKGNKISSASTFRDNGSGSFHGWAYWAAENPEATYETMPTFSVKDTPSFKQSAKHISCFQETVAQGIRTCTPFEVYEIQAFVYGEEALVQILQDEIQIWITNNTK